MENNTILYKVKPKFNLIYEMFMPTGRKVRNALSILIVFIIFYIVLNIIPGVNGLKSKIIETTSIDVFTTFSNVVVWVILLIAIKAIIHLVIQIWQYNSIQYSFYEGYLEYTDMFLNQQKKTIRYDNIREIEIRKTIWDRINGYGVIIIYTNAEKSYDNGLILYSVKNPQEAYVEIDKIVHSKTPVSIEKEKIEVNNIEEKESEFLNNLKNN